MDKRSLSIAVYLFARYGILGAHVVDIHPKTPKEEQMLKRAEKERQNKKAEKTLKNEKATRKEKQKAYRTLAKNGKMA